MPQSCAVPFCKSRGGFIFPKDRKLRETWLVKIRRQGPNNSKWEPKHFHVVCEEHFLPTDFYYTGKRKKLVPGAFPSIFAFNPVPSERKVAASLARANRALSRANYLEQEREKLFKEMPRMEIKLDPDNLEHEVGVGLNLEIHNYEAVETTEPVDPLAIDEDDRENVDYINLKDQLRESNESIPIFDECVFDIPLFPDAKTQIIVKVNQDCVRIYKVKQPMENPGSKAQVKVIKENIKAEDKEILEAAEEQVMHAVKIEKISFKGFRHHDHTYHMEHTAPLSNDTVITTLFEENQCTSCFKELPEDQHARHTEKECKGLEPLEESSPNHLCPICQRLFSSEKAVEKHLTQHRIQQEKMFCPSCLMDFHVHELNNHFRRKHDCFSGVCIVCRKVMKLQELCDHLEVHNDQSKNNSLLCPHCGKMFNMPFLLANHVERVHGMANEKICDICGKVCKSLKLFKIHFKNCHSDKTIKCDLCDSVFRTSEKMKQHRILHSVNRPFKCALCTHRARRKEHVALHLKKIHNITGDPAKIIKDQEYDIPEEKVISGKIKRGRRFQND